MFAIVDVYNRGGASSMGIVLSLHERKPSLSTIARVAERRAGGPNSGGYIPCVGVKLIKKEGVEYYPGRIISEWHCAEIFGDERSIRSIENQALTYFDKDDLIAQLKLTGLGRPVKLDNGKRYNVILDENTVKKARKIGSGNLSEGLRLAVDKFEHQGE
jgi:hypothetical protein